MNDLTQQLVDVANNPESTRKDMAIEYRFGLRWRTDSHDVDWKVVNAAIMKHWSKSGLMRIKEWAWNGIPNGRGGKT